MWPTIQNRTFKKSSCRVELTLRQYQFINKYCINKHFIHFFFFFAVRFIWFYAMTRWEFTYRWRYICYHSRSIIVNRTMTANSWNYANLERYGYDVECFCGAWSELGQKKLIEKFWPYGTCPWICIRTSPFKLIVILLYYCQAVFMKLRKWNHAPKYEQSLCFASFWRLLASLDLVISVKIRYVINETI